jgi:hypothetical protein
MSISKDGHDYQNQREDGARDGSELARHHGPDSISRRRIIEDWNQAREEDETNLLENLMQIQ